MVAPIMTEMAIVLGMVRFRHQYFDVLANHLLRRIAEQALSSGINRSMLPYSSMVTILVQREKVVLSPGQPGRLARPFAVP